MKFGKRLATEAGRCWTDAYLDYKAIKRAIKNDIAAHGVLFLTNNAEGGGLGAQVWAAAAAAAGP